MSWSPKIIRRSSLRFFLLALSTLGLANSAWGQQWVPNSDKTSSETTVPANIGRLPEDVQQVLWSVPEETETLFVSRGNIPVDAFEFGVPPEGGPARPLRSFSKAYEMQDLAAMNCIEPLVYPSMLYGVDLRGRMVKRYYGPRTTILFAKAVSRGTMGAVEVCDIVVFRDNVADRLARGLTAVPVLPRDVNRVRVFKIDLNNGFGLGRALYRWFAAPRANIFVATTSDQLIETVVKRMNVRARSRALPADLPEWGQVDVTAPVWAIRHYRPEIAKVDKTSMLGRDPNARGGGVVFC